MKRHIFTIAVSLCSLLGMGCSETDDANDPFAGTDNYLFSLVLHNGAHDYEAQIVGDRITLTVAPGTSLTGAAAEYELSELSTIAPDPATVSEWNEEQRFVVTSYSGTERVYTYACVEADDIHEGDVVLKTQAEVDAFGALGRDVIDGSLILGTTVSREADDVSDIAIDDVSALSGIRKISGNIVVNNTVRCKTFKMESLESVNAVRVGNRENGNIIGTIRYMEIGALSFPNLRSIEGECRIINTFNLTEVSMPALRRIGGDLYAYGYGMTSTGLYFDVLEEVQNIHISLGSQTHTIHMPNLRLAADIWIWNNNACVSFPLLEAADAIACICGQFSAPAMKRCVSFTLSGISEQEGYCDCSSLEEMTGQLELPTNTVEDNAFFFQKLETVGGRISGSARLWSMFPALKRFGGLILYNNIGIYHVEIDEIDLTPYEIGTLGIEIGFGLKRLSGPDEYSGELYCRADAVSGFRTVGALNIVGCKSNEFECVEGNSTLHDTFCPNLDRVGRDLTVSGDSPLPALRSVGRKLELFPSVAEYSLPALEEIGDGTLSATAHCLAIGEDAYLPDLRKIEFPVLKRVRGMVYMNPDGDLIGLKTISAPQLEAIEGALYIGRTPRYNPSNGSVLETIDFPRLQSAASVEINYNPSLKDFSSFLTVVRTLQASRWKTSNNGYNPSWQDMMDGKYTE